MSDAGAKVIGISDVYGGCYDETALDIDYLLDRRDSFGTVTRLFKDTITNQELLELDCDILVPAAVENQITAANAHRIKADIVVEAANGPTTLEATRILHERGVLLVPDVLASAGGVPSPTLNGSKTTRDIIGRKKKWSANWKRSWSRPSITCTTSPVRGTWICGWPLTWSGFAKWRKHPAFAVGYK